MRRKWGLVFTLAVLGGAALHFLYDVWPNPLTAVLAPVNESVWEHLKLLYWPFLAAAFVLARGADDAGGRWCGLLVGLLAAPLLLLGRVLSAPVRLRRARAAGSICFCTCWRWARGFCSHTGCSAERCRGGCAGLL